MESRTSTWLPNSNYDIVFKTSILRWDEALPLGNGLTGCLIYGDGYPLKLSLDRGDLWDNRQAPETMQQDFTYNNLIKIVKNQDQESIRSIFDKPYNRATPTKIPAGKIAIYYNEPTNINSHLSIVSGCADIRITAKEEQSVVKMFMHATRKIGCISIAGSHLVNDIKIIPPGFSTLQESISADKELESNISKGSLKKLIYPKVELGESKNCEWFIQKTAEDLEYSIVMAKKQVGKNTTIVFCIASNKDGTNWFENAKTKVLKYLDLGFEELLQEHTQWWKEFWLKSSIDIPDKSLETMWYQTNYLLGSCSRKGAPPMPLQGVWTADDGQLPPWKGDYHNDLNTQFSYMNYLKSNHIEEGEAFLDLLHDLVPQARKFAKEFFDAPGLCLPSVMTIEGKPLGGWPMYSLNLTNQIWLCQSFERHWTYTGDEVFLKDRAYPYLKETAECVLRWLEEDSTGKLYLPLSSSPEVHDDELEAFVTPNSHYDLALLHYIFKTLTTMAVECNIDSSRWEDVLKSLPKLAVNKSNVLMLSPTESLTKSHRHLSHTMAIFPLNLLNYNTSEADRIVIDATIDNLEELGSGLWVGFSFTWMAELYARQGNGEGASFQLKQFYENLCSPNGFHLNGDYKKKGLTRWHYRPFTLESNMCAADALQEMLLQTYDRIIRVFPAIPEWWKSRGTKFNDFRAMDGILVSSFIKDNELKYIQLKVAKSGYISINNSFISSKLLIIKQQESEGIDCKVNNNFSIYLEALEVCTITSR